MIVKELIKLNKGNCKICDKDRIIGTFALIEQVGIDSTDEGQQIQCMTCEYIYDENGIELKEELSLHPDEDAINRFLEDGECPFCGKENELNYWTSDYQDMVQCPDCKQKWSTVSDVVTIEIAGKEYNVHNCAIMSEIS